MHHLHAMAGGKFTVPSFPPYTRNERSLGNAAANYKLFKTPKNICKQICRNSLETSRDHDQSPMSETLVITASEIVVKKPRLLCLHGFRTSGDIFKKQLEMKWPKQLLETMDLVFPDGLFHAQGKSDVQGIFDPPYYEWFQFNKEFGEYTNLDECFAFVEDYMIKNGPFDGFFGFSQGAALAAALLGLQQKGLTLTKVPQLKCLIVVSGAKVKHVVSEKAFSSPLECPSLHFLGERDYLKRYGLKLLESCVDSVTIQHHKGHTIPELDDNDLETVLSFIEKIQKMLHVVVESEKLIT